MCCSSGIIFGLYCYGGLWPGQFECVPYYTTMIPLVVEIIIIRCYNCNPWTCVTISNLASVLIYAVFMPVPVLPMIVFFFSLVKLWVMFLSSIDFFIMFLVKDQVEHSQYIME